MAKSIEDILNPFRTSYASGSDTMFGSGGNYLSDNNTMMSDSLLGDSGAEMDFLTNQLKDSGSDVYKYFSDPANADSASKYAQDAYGKDQTAGSSLFDFGGGTDGKIMGMDTGKFALGLGNLGLGFMNYLGAKEYNDTKIDGMKQNMALTQEQFDMFKDFNTKQNNRWS